MTAKEIGRKLTTLFSAATMGRFKTVILTYWKSTPTALKAITTIVAALNAGWHFYSRLSPSVEAPSKGKVNISLPEKPSTNVTSSTEFAPKEKTTPLLPDKPSIAVLLYCCSNIFTII